MAEAPQEIVELLEGPVLDIQAAPFTIVASNIDRNFQTQACR
jgi:hypothetical protein